MIGNPRAHSSPIRDEHYRVRFEDVPQIVSSWVEPERAIRGADVLDFGCGEGVTALGLALRYHPRRVVGVDIMPDPERCLPLARQHIGLESLPPSLVLHRVTPGSLHDPADRFDIAYSWSVFEHVDQRLLLDSLVLIRNALRPGGLFLAQIAPLYFSAHGSHLTHKIAQPWGHLLTQDTVLRERLAAATPDADEFRALESVYGTLNRLTAPEFVEAIKAAGFKILRTYVTKDKEKPTPELLRVFNRDVLTTNQVVVLSQPR
jgi:cyclopropane fatty-acyl-phospholipid synthase-like methyltransferase